MEPGLVLLQEQTHLLALARQCRSIPELLTGNCTGKRWTLPFQFSKEAFDKRAVYLHQLGAFCREDDAQGCRVHRRVAEGGMEEPAAGGEPWGGCRQESWAQARGAGLLKGPLWRWRGQTSASAFQKVCIPPGGLPCLLPALLAPLTPKVQGQAGALRCTACIPCPRGQGRNGSRLGCFASVAVRLPAAGHDLCRELQ